MGTFFIVTLLLVKIVDANLYNMSKGFSPIIQTMFGNETNTAVATTPFINEPGGDMCIHRDDSEINIHDCSFDSGHPDTCDQTHCKYIPPFKKNFDIC